MKIDYIESNKKLLPNIESPSKHFYYSGLNYIEVGYLVSKDQLGHYFDNTNLIPYLFNGKACITINYQQYFSNFQNGHGETQEIEIGVYCIPRLYKEKVPTLDLKDFLMGEDQTKLIGIYRIFVPCDDELAIDAGINKFGEPKFLANFKSSMPSYNDLLVRDWKISCNEFEDHRTMIFSLEINLEGLPRTISNISPITYYGYRDGELIGSRWNIHQPLDTFFIPENCENKVNLMFGSTTNNMGIEIKKILNGIEPFYIREHINKPVAIQSRPFFVV
ncbi:hypothetical protein [Robertmurraya kyonggiensis]|uniref:Acetoacetate decarboxylase n=1 Tax=Robertmurraya kyonggiensis TaxID=1037680 RepID=A0A4U1DC83_9BACI|nr:hypothetical protein [Robertmurraya kyonggiensis]TKC19106.1 hypothetical protein FA727_06045 [Robertmurraya kyonggiensis]